MCLQADPFHWGLTFEPKEATIESMGGEKYPMVTTYLWEVARHCCSITHRPDPRADSLNTILRNFEAAEATGYH
jgi:hypothetical protein